MIALDPNQTTSFEFHGVRYTARYLTARQMLAYRNLLNAAHAAEDDSGPDKVAQAIAMALTDWSGVIDRRPRDGEQASLVVAFKPAILPDLMTPAELWGLAYQILSELDLSEQKKRKSESPSASSTDSSVAAVVASA